MSRNRLWSVVPAAVAGLLLLAACGKDGTGDSLMPPLRPSQTPLSPATPTDIPEPDPIQLPAVDWNNVDQFRAAMLPAYAGDIDQFVDRNRYYIEASLDYEEPIAAIRGAERVRYTNHSADALDQIVFRLYANLASFGGRMIIYRAAINDQPAYERPADPNANDPNMPDGYRNTVFLLDLPEPLQPDQSVEITLEFSVTSERGMYASYGQWGFQDNVFSGPEWVPTLSVYTPGEGWWMGIAPPDGDAAFTESGLYETYLTVPEHFVVAMSGSEIESIPVGDGKKTLHYVSGPMRNSLLVASPLFGKITQEVDGVAVNVYYWPGGESPAEDVLKVAVNSVRAFDKNFGQYPFAEFDVVETFNATGVEYPGIVIIADESWVRGDPFLEVTVAHEAAHQWWYSLVGNDQVDQPWLDESLTSYSEYVYAYEVYGERRARDWENNHRDNYNFYRGTGAPDLPLNLPVSSYTDNNYGMIIYRKGPLFFAELEELLGRDTFLKGLQLYFEQHRYEVVQSVDMLNAMEEVSGQQLDELFYQWVGEFPGLDPDVVAEMHARQQQGQSQ